ncbi:MAG: hypothetical protein ISR58_03075 [Anaerolineales bacterium]|nr:hypothetical protein [Chloroflexota bacterium]MBL6980154.1 hypothetical protein [Anaerolineales bacterium]
MKANFFLVFCIVSLTLVISGCDAPIETPAVDAEATIGASKSLTATAEAAFQEAVDEAVHATVTAMPTPDLAEYSDVSEEELAEEVDTAVNEAENASEQASDAVDEAAADGTITQEEIDEIEALLNDLEYAIALANELIYAYYGIYGELATETLYLLQAIEEDLDELAAFAIEMVELALMVEDALMQGLEVATEVVDQLVGVAGNLDDKVASLLEKRGTWKDALSGDLENRVADILNIAANQVAGDRKDAILSAFDFVDSVRNALGDGALSNSELLDIGQLSANARASIDAAGGPLLQSRSGEIGDITSQLARGQLPQAQSGLGALEGALGSRPSR